VITPPQPLREEERLRALEHLDVLDTATEEVFDRITRLASNIAETPIALLSLVDSDRQWFKSRVGLGAAQTSRDISFCGHAILDPRPFVIRDAQLDDRFSDNPLVTGGPHIRYYCGVPLEVPGQHRIGTLCVIDQKPRTLAPKVHEALEDLAAMAVRELQLRQAALADPLTGASNRRMLAMLGPKELARTRRTGSPLAALLLDLDRFKAINDRHGHPGGDKVLVEVSRAIEACIRTQDTVFRLDGEAFAVLLTDISADNAHMVAERIRTCIAGMSIPFGKAFIPCTVSIGVAGVTPHDTSFAQILARAEMGLQAAKATGRNRAIFTEDSRPSMQA